MKRLLLLVALFGVAAARPAPAPRALATPEGGVRIGPADAKLKLVEYLSYTCPHCAAFSSEGAPTLIADAERGAISYEVRIALRDRLDYVAAMLARCGGPAHVLPLTQAILAAQQDWFPKAARYDAEHPSDLMAADGGLAAAVIVTQSGLDAIAAREGVTAAMLPRCLADPASRAAIEGTTKQAWDTLKIEGTPGFFIDGAYQKGVFTWAALQPKLAAARKG